MQKIIIYENFQVMFTTHWINALWKGIIFSGNFV